MFVILNDKHYFRHRMMTENVFFLKFECFSLYYYTNNKISTLKVQNSGVTDNQ